VILQDVMVVGEPSLMGGEFGDEDERLITRLENTQYDAANSLEEAAFGDGGPGGMPPGPGSWPGPGGEGGRPPPSTPSNEDKKSPAVSQ
jgi:LIM domain-binding protein 2